MDYEKISETTIKQLYASYGSLAHSPLDPKIRRLVELRTSQMNGCEYCCKLHLKDALAAGASQEQLDDLHHWKNSSHFDKKEQLALHWCEILTTVDTDQKNLRDALAENFSEREIVDLTATISLMNALNRIAIYLRSEH